MKNKITMVFPLVLGFILVPHFASAAIPTVTSAKITNSTETTVDLEIYGTDFDTFVNSGKTEANATDLSKITYKTYHPISAWRWDSDKIVATFPIAIGTGTQTLADGTTGFFSDVTLATDTIQDTNQFANTSLLIVPTTSISDEARPVVMSTSPADGNYDIPVTSNVIVNFSEPMDTSPSVAGVTDVSTDAITWSTHYIPSWPLPTWSNNNHTVTYQTNTLPTGATMYGITTIPAAAGTGTSNAILFNGNGQYTWTFTTHFMGSYQNTTATTVDIVLTGTGFGTFVNSGTTIANTTDLAKISYLVGNGAHPLSAQILNSNTMRLQFNIQYSSNRAHTGSVVSNAYLSILPNTIVSSITGLPNPNSLPVLTADLADNARPIVRDVFENTGEIRVYFSEKMDTTAMRTEVSLDPTFTSSLISSYSWPTTAWSTKYQLLSIYPSVSFPTGVPIYVRVRDEAAGGAYRNLINGGQYLTNFTL